ncbi:MAG: hypothetical protein ABIO49_00440, partial [Dokdonella sp.]
MPDHRVLHALACCAVLPLLVLARPGAAAITIDLSYVDQQSVEFQLFKGFVDEAVAGHPDYGFSAADAAYMYKITGQAQYATLAVQTVDAQVNDAEAVIAGGAEPDIARDQYLYSGGMIEDVALTYDWCASFVSPSQHTHWNTYAEQTVWNIWNHDNAV